MDHITIATATAAVLLAGALAGCTGPSQPLNGDGAGGAAGTITIEGSSTVYPIAEAWGEEYNEQHRGVQFAAGFSGTGGGFQKLCRGETDISDASRPIKASEEEACRREGIEPFEIEVAIDGLAVVVSAQNDFVDHLTVEELNRIWTADTAKQANRWSHLRPEWPGQPIERYGPGTNSGTFDYFVEAIIHPFDGTDTGGRSDYTPSEDDHVLVNGVRSSPHALGYFGLAYAVENAGSVRIVPIDEGEGQGPVLPTPAHVESGRYSPLSRPLFMYTDGPPSGIVRDFLAYGLSEEGQGLVEEVGYIKLPEAKRSAMRARVEGG